MNDPRLRGRLMRGRAKSVHFRQVYETIAVRRADYSSAPSFLNQYTAHLLLSPCWHAALFLVS